MIELQEGIIPEIEVSKPYALVAITKHGVQKARQMAQDFPNVDVYYMAKFEHGDEQVKGIQLFKGTVRLLLPALFKNYKGLILIISLGAVVRMIAPILEDKKKDPAVLVIDDKGEHVISVLSGHIGGANALTHEVANAIGGKPIITTASDVQKTIPVDLFGARFGWIWESDEKLTPVSASVVNEESVAIVQEAGETGWWMHETPIPANIRQYQTIKQAIESKPDAALIITDRILDTDEEGILENGVIYRPKSLVLGMGCNRGTSVEEIDAVIDETLSELKLAKKSIKALATIDLKKDEQCFIDITNRYGWKFATYTPEQLNEMPLLNPSETVFKFTGAYGVSEPAAMRYANTTDLLLQKKKHGNVTISIARMTFH
ncbi:cobalt-precorrin 5A hydrolase [Ureibacillus sinduriensis]|uniref:Cobalamin biosynthesis protein CbiG n=1 Tax=Ureibacillus sinduriensis BLB-1 = JCM 15800 TaxID=1384057 RepID=A0A0A3HNU1_9BACL|nr:cobalamin biosynthesis protein [Ureibacillus sinduriensis]KGR74054.1 cobalamin biosynthesis protein CbiG [Ureibacillus sinduriensis BLB-1 = JCM 15800]